MAVNTLLKVEFKEINRGIPGISLVQCKFSGSIGKGDLPLTPGTDDLTYIKASESTIILGSADGMFSYTGALITRTGPQIGTDATNSGFSTVSYGKLIGFAFGISDVAALGNPSVELPTTDATNEISGTANMLALNVSTFADFGITVGAETKYSWPANAGVDTNEIDITYTTNHTESVVNTISFRDVNTGIPGSQKVVAENYDGEINFVGGDILTEINTQVVPTNSASIFSTNDELLSIQTARRGANEQNYRIIGNNSEISVLAGSTSMGVTGNKVADAFTNIGFSFGYSQVTDRRWLIDQNNNSFYTALKMEFTSSNNDSLAKLGIADPLDFTWYSGDYQTFPVGGNARDRADQMFGLRVRNLPAITQSNLIFTGKQLRGAGAYTPALAGGSKYRFELHRDISLSNPLVTGYFTAETVANPTGSYAGQPTNASGVYDNFLNVPVRTGTGLRDFSTWITSSYVSSVKMELDSVTYSTSSYNFTPTADIAVSSSRYRSTGNIGLKITQQ
tara:strand:- start:123 stop:1646 length:1524 start_codon:yes stop_codon:yes gene_type:complete